MDYMTDKFPLKCEAGKGTDFYLEPLMDPLESMQYYSKNSSKSNQHYTLQNPEHHSILDRSSPCDNQSSELATLCPFSHSTRFIMSYYINAYVRLFWVVNSKQMVHLTNFINLLLF